MRRPRTLSRRSSRSAAASLAMCGTAVVAGQVSVFADPFKVGGLEATDGPTGLRPDGTAESRQVNGTDGGRSTSSPDSRSAISRSSGSSPIRTPSTVNSNPSKRCTPGTPTPTTVSSAATPPRDWSTPGSAKGQHHRMGPDGPDAVVAKVPAATWPSPWSRPRIRAPSAEASGPEPQGVATLVAEQQADCFAGVYMRWVAGQVAALHPEHRRGLNNLLAAMISFRDRR